MRNIINSQQNAYSKEYINDSSPAPLFTHRKKAGRLRQSRDSSYGKANNSFTSKASSPYRTNSSERFLSNRFHQNDTLPPNAVRQVSTPRTILEGEYDSDDYHTSQTLSMKLRSKNRNSGVKKEVRVRIEGAKNLLPPSCAGQIPPSTYVTVEAAYGRGKSPIIYKNASPPFNDEFCFEVSNPKTEEITVTVVAVTSQVRKKLGQCVFSVLNLRCGVERRQWVSLVRHPGTTRAYECGAMLVSFYTDSFGTDYCPSFKEENEFREKLRALLQKNAPEELHRLEWYVGECIADYDGAYAELCEKYQRPESQPASFRLTIRSVANLTVENGTPTTRETCYVKVVAGRLKKNTKMVPYHREATFNTVFDLVLDNPKAQAISIEVYSTNYKFGECLISLMGLQRNVPKERTHHIVHAAGTGDAYYCGVVNVVLNPGYYNADMILSDNEYEARRFRVKNYLWKYLRDDLHRLDPIVTSIDEINIFMKTLVRDYGPEPHPYPMRLHIDHFLRDTKKESLKKYAIVIRVGPEEYRSESARHAHDFIFNTEVTLPVCTPEKDELLFIVIEEANDKEVEVGRVSLSLKNIQRDHVFQRKLRVYGDALTDDAKAIGTLFIEGIVNGFGLTEQLVDDAKENYFRQRVKALLSRYDPSQLHRVEYLLGGHVGQEAELIKQLTNTYGPETGVAPMQISITCIREFVPMCSCYVKVYLNKVPVLRTKDHFPAKSLVFDIGMKNEATVQMEDPIHSFLTFKVAEHRLFRRSRVLGVAELSLRSMVRDELNVCWLPIIDEKNQEEIGLLGVQLQSTGFIRGAITIYDKPGNGDGKTVMEKIIRDVTSLVHKYSSKDLPRVQPLIAQIKSPRDAHRELRKRLAPTPVSLTFYVHIDQVTMRHNEERAALENGCIVVCASCLKERVRSFLKIIRVNRIDTRKFFPDIRMDVFLTQEVEVSLNGNPLEIILYEVSGSAGQKTPAVAHRRSHYSFSHRFLLPEKELGRAVLSLRALLTEPVFHLGEAITVPIVSVDDRSVRLRASTPSRGVACGSIVGEITLRITTPAFERIPRRLQFSAKLMRFFDREYVRYYERRIASFYQKYDLSALRNFHFTLYERDVASGRWPLSLQDWLVGLVRQHGPELSGGFGPPPQLPFDPLAVVEEAERGEEGFGTAAFLSSEWEKSMKASVGYQTPRGRRAGSSQRVRSGDRNGNIRERL